MTTRCEVIRGAVAAASCGLCGKSPNCPADLSPALCSVAKGANAQLNLTASALSLGRFGQVGTLERKDFAADAADAEAAVAAAFPGLPPGEAAISWSDFNRCLVSPDGAADAAGRRRMGRFEAEVVGFAPVYPLGGKALAGTVWKAPFPPIPLAADSLINPDLFTLFLLGLLLAAVGLAVYTAARRKKGPGPPAAPAAGSSP